MENLNKERQKQIDHENTKVACKCEKKFKTTKKLKCHFKNVHRLEKQHQCNICQSFLNFRVN